VVYAESGTLALIFARLSRDFSCVQPGTCLGASNVALCLFFPPSHPPSFWRSPGTFLPTPLRLFSCPAFSQIIQFASLPRSVSRNLTAFRPPIFHGLCSAFCPVPFPSKQTEKYPLSFLLSRRMSFPRRFVLSTAWEKRVSHMQSAAPLPKVFFPGARFSFSFFGFEFPFFCQRF